MVVGTIIGASIFVQPSEITADMRSLGGVVVAWALAGLLTVAGAFLCAELASAFPSSGGVYEFLRRAFSPAVGFLWGWSMFWVMHTGIIAAIAMVFARYVAYFFGLPQLGDAGLRLVAIGAIVVLSVVNYCGVALASGLQAAFTIAKLAAIVVILLLGFWAGARLPAHFVGSAEGAARWSGLGKAVGAGLFAFGGWHMVTYTAEETRDAGRTIPRALLVGTLVVVAVYVALNTLYLYVLPLDRVIASRTIAADVAAGVGGPGGGTVAALVAVSAFGAVAGIVLAGPRAYFSMARDGLLFRWLGDVHPRFGTPHRAIVLQGVWSVVLVATGTYRQLFSRVVYTEWVFFGAMAAGVLLLRRRADYRPEYRAPGGALVPAVFAVCAALVAGAQILGDVRGSASGLLLVGAGLPVYYVWGRVRQGAPAA